MENIWKIYGNMYIYIWNVNVYGIYICDMENMWKIYGIYIWVVYGINIYILWNVYGIEYVWNIDRIYNRGVKQMNEI